MYLGINFISNRNQKQKKYFNAYEQGDNGHFQILCLISLAHFALYENIEIKLFFDI